MTKLITRIGDQVLRKVLREEKAGACTTCPGPCSYWYGWVCYSDGTCYYERCTQHYTCDCGCQPNFGNCVLD